MVLIGLSVRRPIPAQLEILANARASGSEILAFHQKPPPMSLQMRKMAGWPCLLQKRP